MPSELPFRSTRAVSHHRAVCIEQATHVREVKKSRKPKKAGSQPSYPILPGTDVGRRAPTEQPLRVCSPSAAHGQDQRHSIFVCKGQAIQVQKTNHKTERRRSVPRTYRVRTSPEDNRDGATFVPSKLPFRSTRTVSHQRAVCIEQATHVKKCRRDMKSHHE